MLVVPAEAGIQCLKSLDPGQKHAGMTIKWDSSGADLFSIVINDKRLNKPDPSGLLWFGLPYRFHLELQSTQEMSHSLLWVFHEYSG